MTIYVDTSENQCDVPRLLKKRGNNIVNKQLPSGDYILITTQAILALERKTEWDYVESLRDGRLNNQHYKMSTAFDYYVVAIEGDLQLPVSSEGFDMNALMGSLAGGLLRRSPDGKQGACSIIPTFNEEGTAALIHFLHEKMSTEEGMIRLPHLPRLKFTDDERIGTILELYPNVGPERRKELIRKFKTIKKVLNADIKELIAIPGIGKIIAEEIIRLSNLEIEE